MARNIISLLSTEHRRVTELAVRARRGRGSRERYRDELVAAMGAHLHGAEVVMHPFLSARKPQLQADLNRLEADRERAEELLESLVGRPMTDAATSGLIDEVERVFDAHARCEERLLATLGNEEVGKLRDLGAAYLRQRNAHLKSQRVRPSAVPRRLDVPKADLYEQARKAGIAGRSSMSRDELIAALTPAAAPKR